MFIYFVLPDFDWRRGRLPVESLRRLVRDRKRLFQWMTSAPIRVPVFLFPLPSPIAPFKPFGRRKWGREEGRPVDWRNCRSCVGGRLVDGRNSRPFIGKGITAISTAIQKGEGRGGKRRWKTEEVRRGGGEGGGGAEGGREDGQKMRGSNRTVRKISRWKINARKRFYLLQYGGWR